MIKCSLITLLICAMLVVSNISSEQALASRGFKKSSLVKKAVKGVLVIGTAATLVFGGSSLERQLGQQQVDQQAQIVQQDSNPFREAVLELNPTLLAQVVQQVDVNKALFSDGSTALHYAVADGYFQDERSKLRVVDILLEHGADPYLRNGQGVNVFDMAAASDDAQSGIALAAILGKHVHGINASDEAGIRPIEYAIKYAAVGNNALWLAQELATAGADIGVLHDSEYASGIFNYLMHDNEHKILEDAAMLLTDADQFVAAVGRTGKPEQIVELAGDYLFSIATSHGNFAVAEALIELGVDPNDHPYRTVEDNSLRIPLTHTKHAGLPVQAIPESGDLAYVEWLLGVGADPKRNSHTTFELNMLHLAAWHGEIAEVKLLLANGADPTLACASRGRTALHYALTAGDGDYPIQVFKLVNTLLAHNARTKSGINLTEVRDYGGLRPYDVAMRYTDDSFNIYALRSHTIINAATAAILLHNMEGKDSQGRTAAYWADLSGLERIKELIKQGKGYLSGEELDSFAEYLRNQMSSWDS